MTVYKQFDVVSVPFPFTDKASMKKRPALVLSTQDYQINVGHCILAMITTAKQSSWAYDVHITNIALAGLPVASKIRFKIFSLDEKLIIKTLGQLVEEDINIVTKNLKQMILFSN